MTTNKYGIDRHVWQLLRAAGYRWLRRRKHHIWEHATTKRRVVVPGTPSDHRALRNLTAYLLREARR